MPKSGFSANAQAKVVAKAIVEELAGRVAPEPLWENTCYALAGKDYGLFVADVFKILDDNEHSMLIKIDYVSLIRYIKHWSFNRQINDDFVNELYESIVENNKIIWTLTAIKERSNNNLYLIDGQHRFEAIKKRMTEDNNLQFNNNLTKMKPNQIN